jgi:hypothetical protein
MCVCYEATCVVLELSFVKGFSCLCMCVAAEK